MFTRFARLALASAAVLCLLAQASSVNAGTILSFSQNGTAVTTETVNSGSGTTSLDSIGTATAVTITAYAGGGTPISAYFQIHVDSVGVAVTDSFGQVAQQFQGFFVISSNNATFSSATDGAIATNYLSGNFTVGVLGGANNSPTFSVNSATFYSSILTGLTDESFSLSFSGLTSPKSIVAGSTSSFKASVAGTFAANAVPEPASAMSFAIGTLGVIGYGLRRLRARKS